MASKRKLKKTMQSITSELIMEVFLKSLFSTKDITAKADKLALEINDFNLEHIRRINNGGGKDNPKEVRKYFQKLYADWDAGVEKIIAEIEKL